MTKLCGSGHRLDRLDALQRAASRAQAGFADLFPRMPVDLDSSVRRLDFAVDLRMSNALGQDILRRLNEAGLCPPTKHVDVYPLGRGIGSVSWYRGKRIYFRAYDRMPDGAGGAMVLRLERQLNFDKRAQRPTLGWEPRGHRFADLVDSSRGLDPLLGVDGALDILDAARESGKLGDETAVRLAGAIICLERSGRDSWSRSCERTARRPIHALRKLGIDVVEHDGRARIGPAGALSLNMVLALADKAVREHTLADSDSETAA
jgi:hypothetical protein